MKIGFVLDDRLDKPDGVQQYVSLLGLWLESQGHEVQYLVGDSPNATQKNVHSLSKTINVRFNKNRMAIPLPASRAKIKQILTNEHFDILHVQMPYSPLMAGRVVAAAPKSTAVVGTFHILPHNFVSKTGTKILGHVLSKINKRFDGFISVSSAAKTFARTHFGINSEVIPNVVDIAKYTKGSRLQSLQGKKNIVFLGRFVDRKGANYLLDAYSLLISENNHAVVPRLVLCGDGPDKVKLQKIAKTAIAKGGDVLFTGFLKEEEKANYLASADIAVFPSTGGESFGIVLIEAMAAGSKVVLGGDNDGYKTVLGDQPLSLVHPQSTKIFADRLHQLLFDEKLAKKLGTSQLNTVKQYDIKVVGPRLVKYYNAALARRRSTIDN